MWGGGGDLFLSFDPRGGSGSKALKKRGHTLFSNGLRHSQPHKLFQTGEEEPQLACECPFELMRQSLHTTTTQGVGRSCSGRALFSAVPRIKHGAHAATHKMPLLRRTRRSLILSPLLYTHYTGATAALVDGLATTQSSRSSTFPPGRCPSCCCCCCHRARRDL